MADQRIEGTSRAALSVCAVAYLAGVVAATVSPGPLAWGLHSPGFLSPILRAGTIGVLVCGAILLFHGALRPGSVASVPVKRRGPAPTRGKAKALNRAQLLPLLLLPLAALFWILRARTQFLGDGTVWLSGLQSGIVTAKSEPLSGAIWLGFSALLRATGRPITANTVAIVPILCGLASAAFAWGIAREIAPQKHGTKTAVGLLLTLGVTQLFCGYIESYPPVAMFVLGFLWVGLRRVRGDARALFLLPISFALCVASHFATATLAPAYVLLALRGSEPRARRLALAAIGPALAIALLLLLGSKPQDWLHSLGTASRGADVTNLSTTVVEPAYGVLSLDHLVDFLNALLLILPIPLLLLAAQVVARRGRITPLAPDTGFLALAAIPGVALAALFRFPLAPAQDWDLTSILLLPLAVLGIRVGHAIFAAPEARRFSAGLVTLALGSLLPFLLVNANEASAIRRFETILAPDAKVTSFARAYGNYALWRLFSGRGDHERAHPYAVRALESEKGNPRYWTNVGLDLYQMKRYGEALPYLEEGAKRGPDIWVSRYDLGLCLKEMRRYEEAAREFRIASRIGGGRPEVLHNLGIALYRAGHPDSAVAIWQEVSRRWPAYESALKRANPAAPTAPAP